jgi:FdhE protein
MPQSRESVSATLNAIASRRPALHSILSAFEPLLTASAALPDALADELRNGTAPLPQARSERLAQGVPVMADAPTQWAAPLMRVAARHLLPVITAHQSLAGSRAGLEKAFDQDDTALAGLMSAIVHGDAGALTRAARQHDVPEAVFAFAANAVAGPVLHAMTQHHLHDADFAAWREGTCPVCGSFPSIAYLGRPDPDQSEFLRSGGGKKHLHCSLCTHEWLFRRGACPSCGNEDPGALEYLRDPQTPWERIDLCRKCNTYCPGVDLRETTENPQMDAMALGMLHLDLVAAREGLMPLAPSFWNTFDDE